MIGYRIADKDLKNLIESESPGWLARAKGRSKLIDTAGVYNESNSIWSEVKVVYMRLQGESKCMYCERKLEGEERGKYEQDVEHFRPKKGLSSWSVSPSLQSKGVTATNPPTGGKGYHRLAYHVFNYGASCKPCNSALKSDYFPIAGKYKTTGSSPRTLVSEKPLLIYPIGTFDTDPEALIHFYGISPQPVASHGHARHRALATIAFFELDDPLKRKNLVRERAMVIVAMFPQLEVLAGASGKKATARKLIDGFTSEKAVHANCARSFRMLHAANRNEAEIVFELAAEFIESSS